MSTHATLNDLIATTLDSADGYERAAERAESHRFADLFRARARERREVVAQLQAEVVRLGHTPEDDGTVLAAMHRGWLSLRDSISTQDDDAIVAEVERGEDHIKAKYEKALESGDLDGASRTVIQNAWASVKTGHDQMRDLKHGLSAA